MKCKIKTLFSCVFALGILCLGLCFTGVKNSNLYRVCAMDSNTAIDAIINGKCVDKGGSIYLAGGSTYTMNGGTISGHLAEKGGAFYIGDGATFTMNSGTITGNYAKYGGAIYVANGGECYINGGTITGNFAENAPAIYVETGGLLQVSSTAIVEDNLYLEKEFPINIYVDGVLSKTIYKPGDIYTIDESEMPLDYESCCGYFYDEKLSECTNGEVDLTRVNEEITFAPRTATVSGGINIYTKTASDTSNFTFSYNQTTGTYDIKASSTSISGTMVLPKHYNNVQTSIYNATSYSSGAFYKCTSMTGITFQDGLTSISNCAFGSCSGFTGSLIIPDSVTSIGNEAFSGCVGLTGNLIIPDRVTSIGDSAFSGCSGFTGSLIIPDSVESIENYAFYYCTGFTSIYLPSSVTTIVASGYYEAPFADCSNDLIIYTDVEDASSKPSGWSMYWNCTDGSLHTVNYGYSLAQYKAAVGVTFAPNNNEVEETTNGIEIGEKGLNFVNNFKQNAILNDKKEYVILPKKTVE